MKGRRQVSWDRKKGGVKKFKWVSRAGKDLCKGKLGLGPNKLAAQLSISKSSLGPNTISPITFEPRKCSVNCVRPIISVDTHEKAGESPGVSLTSSEMPIQVARGPVRSPKVWVQAENGGTSFSMPLVLPMSLVLPIQEECRTGIQVVLPTQVVSPVGATQADADGVVPTHQCCASPVGVSGCTESPPIMVFRLSLDWNCILGSILLLGGLISKGKRTVTLELVPRLVGPSFPDLFLELLQAGSLGFGVLGQEVYSSYSKDLLSLPREVMLVEEAVDFSTGFGETDLSVCLPLQIITPSASTNLAKLEEVNEVLSIETKLDISRWVKHRILGFSKLVGLSMSRNGKLCTALLQRLELKMEAANVLHKKATGSKKVAKSKKKERRELQNLISSVNYYRR